MLYVGPQVPRFELVGSATQLLTAPEIAGLIARHSGAMSDARVGEGATNYGIRRSKVMMLHPDAEHLWLYERLAAAAQQFNQLYFGIDITGVGAVQLARYDAQDEGFFDWHMDFGEPAVNRKISITVQMSAPEDYEGGELELFFHSQTYKAPRDRGMGIAFPSWVVHRVSPVTRGTRWSLVCWISGPRWR